MRQLLLKRRLWRHARFSPPDSSRQLALWLSLPRWLLALEGLPLRLLVRSLSRLGLLVCSVMTRLRLVLLPLCLLVTHIGSRRRWTTRRGGRSISRRWMTLRGIDSLVSSKLMSSLLEQLLGALLACVPGRCCTIAGSAGKSDAASDAI